MQFVVLFLVVMMLLTMVAFVAALLISVLVCAALAFAVGYPLWHFLFKPWVQGQRAAVARHVNPIERLQRLYIEGKIDLFEFERRVARLLAVERL
jgi:hypothetical protein